ncbi:MAG: outer membrane lipoprotein carrier protein LolA [Vicinamibacterales bacterium]
MRQDKKLTAVPGRRFARCMGVALLAIGLAVAPRPARAQDTSPVTVVVANLQKKYSALRDFSAAFVHTYEGGVLRKKASERGTVEVKKPGKMRWSYTAPEEKLFVSDGVRMYAYVPADRQVIVSRVPDAREATTPIQFLAGAGDLQRDFTASWAPAENAFAGLTAVKLVPRKRQAEYEWIVLGLEPTTLAIRVLQSADAQGGTSTFTFSEWRDNVGLADSRFAFKIPRGTDVINQ